MLRESPTTPGDGVAETPATAGVPAASPAADPATPATPASSGVRRVLAGGVLACILAVIVRVAASPLSNTDTYFHLRFGSEFLHHWSLRDPGSVSSFATASWLPTQWLPEMVMAQVESWFGLAGVAWLFGLQMVALALTLYLVARRWAGQLTASVLVCAALVASYKALSMRPQTLSFLLVAVTVAAWMRTREDGRLRWWLVPLTWVWAMVHGMWPLGIGLGVVSVLGLALDRQPRPLVLRALAVPALSAVAAALTPVGPALYGAVLGVGSRAHYFSEWGTPTFTSLPCIVLGLMLLTGVLVMARSGRTVAWFDLGLLAVAAGCAVWSWRTVPVSAMILVPLLARLLGSRPDRVRDPLRRPEVVLTAVAGVLALTVLAIVAPQTADRPPAQPAWVDPALSALPPGTKVLDAWDWGGYLMWRYPQLDLLMHGYGDTFTDAELQRNTDIEGLAAGWDRELRATGCTVAVLRPTALAYALQHQLHWTVVHRSPTIVELRAPAGWPSA